MKEIRVMGLETIPIVGEGDDIGALICEAAEREGIGIEDGDVIVVSHIIVSRAEGRVVELSAIKPSEFAKNIASAMGKDVVRVRMVVLMIGSAIAGLAGALYAFYSGSVHADDYMPIRTFLVWVMVIIGGAGNNLGAALGALVYVTVEKLIMIFKHSIPAPFDINYLSYIILGVILILTLMFRPEGLLPEKPGGPVRLLRRRVEPPG